jgi:hypothetical protein
MQVLCVVVLRRACMNTCFVSHCTLFLCAHTITQSTPPLPPPRTQLPADDAALKLALKAHAGATLYLNQVEVGVCACMQDECPRFVLMMCRM